MSTSEVSTSKASKSNVRKVRRRKFWSRVSLFLLTIWAVFALWQAPVVPAFASNQIRGVWMTNLGAALSHYTMRTDEVVANMAKHHLNTLYPCVWNRGYTLHPSQVVKAAGGPLKEVVTDIPLLPGDDVLKGLAHQAHRQNLRIVPWFEYGLMIPETSAIAQTHPDWLTTTQTGETVETRLTTSKRLPKSLQNFQLEMAGGNLAWLNPTHPEVQQFLTDLIVEVVKNYDVDGIQLDDHFGLPVAFGYDAYTVEAYKTTHNGAAPPNDVNNAEWVAWRAAQVTQLLEKISLAVKQADADAIVSVSPNPPAFAYNKYLQDWRRWVDLGIVDEVLVQVYRDDVTVLKNDLYNGGFYDIREQVPVAIGLYTGPFGAAKPIERLETEIQTVQSAGYAGVSFFCWETTLWSFKGSEPNTVLTTFLQQFS
ncbi:MAG: family 10 glycosylhydrolase [Cyanobacteria bacterium J06621_3]